MECVDNDMAERKSLCGQIYWKMSSLIRDGIKEHLDFRAEDAMDLVQARIDYSEVHG